MLHGEECQLVHGQLGQPKDHTENRLHQGPDPNHHTVSILEKGFCVYGETEILLKEENKILGTSMARK